MFFSIKESTESRLQVWLWRLNLRYLTQSCNCAPATVLGKAADLCQLV